MPKLVPGWKPQSVDLRDHLYAPGPPPAGLPSKVDLRPFDVPLFDQGQLGSCTANATIGCFMFEAKKDNIALEVRSRLQLYYNSRVAEGDPAQDGGAQLRDVIKVLNKQGVCPESDWPYNVAKFAVAPPMNTYADGLLERVTSYAAVAQTLPALKAALAAGRPVAFGFTVYPAFESAAVAKTGIVPMPRGKSVGGHAVRLVGYDDATKRFLVANSWGTGWGDKGYFTMPYAYVVSARASDFWTISACGA